MDLTEAKDVKKKKQECMEELLKKKKKREREILVIEITRILWSLT